MSNRKELEDIIQSGRSVFHGGVLYTDVNDLPSEAALAMGNEAQENEARKSIGAELKRLQSELDLLDEAKHSEKKASEKSEKKESAHADSKSEAKSEEKPESDAKGHEPKKA
jgi:hypothetical protein